MPHYMNYLALLLGVDSAIITKKTIINAVNDKKTA